MNYRNHFTSRAINAVEFAQYVSRKLEQDYIGTEHILLGLLHEEGSVAFAALSAVGVTFDAVMQKVEAMVWILYEVIADHLFLDQDVALKRAKAFHIEQVKILLQVGSNARQDLFHLQAHFGKLIEIRSIWERNLAEIASQTDAAGQDDIAILARCSQPGKTAVAQKRINGHLQLLLPSLPVPSPGAARGHAALLPFHILPARHTL